MRVQGEFLFSVIVPIYNSERYLRECITSVLKQSYNNFELILIDDGSTDSSLHVCRQFEKVDSRIVVFSKPNEGQSSARNLGLNVAKGDFIAFLDSDDLLSFDVLEKVQKTFEVQPEVDVVQFPVYMNFGTAGQYLNLRKRQIITGKDNLFREWIVKGNVSWIVCNKIFRKKIFINLRFQRMYYEDNFIMVQILDNIKSLQIIEEGVYYYITRENSTTTSAHSMQKDLDTQLVNNKIYASLRHAKVPQAKVIIQNKIINVAKSLSVNFNIDCDISSLKNDVKISDVLVSKLPFKEKVKLVLFKWR